MPTASSKGRLSGNGVADVVGDQTLAEPHPTQLRNLVFNYLCHNCYLKTAEAFAKDSAIGHLGVNNVRDRTNARGGPGTTSPPGSSVELSGETVKNIVLRQRIQFEILSGNVQEATVFLNQHFPQVLAEDTGDDEMEITDENVNPSRFEYIAETVNPIHLSLNLRILAFIEACRTVPLVYVPPSQSAESPTSPDTDVTMVAASHVKRNPKDEENRQSELLICVQNLYATVNAIRKSEDRAIYLKELYNVGGLLAYTVPETSPMAKYLHQERRDRVAEQINSAILYHTKMPSVSHLELAVRYTHCLWGMLHEQKAKIPATHHLSGVCFPSSARAQGTGESEKETLHEARPFDLQLLLGTRT